MVRESIQKIEIAGSLSTLAGQASDLPSAVVRMILFIGFPFAERIWFPAKLGNLMGSPASARNVARTVARIMRRVTHGLPVKAAVSAGTGAAIWGAPLAAASWHCRSQC